MLLLLVLLLMLLRTLVGLVACPVDVECTVTASVNERLLADVTDDVTDDAAAVDAFVRDVYDVLSAEVTAGDVTRRSRDTSGTGALDVLTTGDVIMTVAVWLMLLLGLLLILLPILLLLLLAVLLLLLLLLLEFTLAVDVISAFELKLLLADVTADVINDDVVDHAADTLACDVGDADVATEPTSCDVTGDVIGGVTVSTADDWRLVLMLLVSLSPTDPAASCDTVCASDTGLLLLAGVIDDVSGDVTDVDAICDAVDVSSATAGELTGGDVISRSRDVNTGVKLIGDVLMVDDLGLLVLLLLLLLLMLLLLLLATAPLVAMATAIGGVVVATWLLLARLLLDCRVVSSTDDVRENSVKY